MSMFRPRSSGISLTQLIGSLQGRGKNSEESERQRFEHSQSQSAQKILTPVECQPKEKHVRNIIIGTFHEEGSYLFWTLMASGFQLETNHIVSWKFCYLFHRLLRDGHKNVIFDSSPVISYIEQLGVFWHSLPNRYGPMLEKYCVLLSTKLTFHDKHRFFPGNLQFEFKDFRQSVGDSSDAYFEISADVMDYLDCILNLQHAVFASIHQDGTFSHTAQGQCRLRPLVSCIQEANSLYDLLVKMLFEMHSVISPGDLEGHRTRFNGIYHRLRDFYNVSSSYKFLKDLLVIPMLTSQPNFKVKEDIQNYQSPVCCLNNIEEDAHSSHNVLPSYESQDEPYAYPRSQLWINRTTSQSTDNSYVPSVSYLPANLDRIPSLDDSQDLLSLDAANDSQSVRSLATVTQSSVSPVSTEAADELASLKSALRDKDNIMKSMQARILVLEAAQAATISSGHKQLAEVNKKLAASEEKYEKMKEVYANLRDKHVAILQLVDARKKDVPQSEKVNVGMQASEDVYTGDDTPIVELNKELKERIRLLEEEKSKLQKEVNDLAAKATTTEQRLADSQAQLQALTSQRAELESKVNTTDESLKKENEQLSDKCQNLEKQLLALTDHRTKLSDVLEMNRSNIALIRETKLEMEANLVDAIHEKNHFEQRSRDLQEELDKRDQIIVEMKAKFAELYENCKEIARDSGRTLSDEVIAHCQNSLHIAQSREPIDIYRLIADCVRHCVHLEATLSSSDVMCIVPIVNLSCCIPCLMTRYSTERQKDDEETILDLGTSVAELLLLAQYDSGDRFRQLKLQVLTRLESIFSETSQSVPQELADVERPLVLGKLLEEVKALQDKTDGREGSKLLLKSIEQYLEEADSVLKKQPKRDNRLLAEYEKSLSVNMKALLVFLSSGEEQPLTHSEFAELRKSLWSVESDVWLITCPAEEVSALFDRLESLIQAGSSLFNRLNPSVKIES